MLQPPKRSHSPFAGVAVLQLCPLSSASCQLLAEGQLLNVLDNMKAMRHGARDLRRCSQTGYTPGTSMTVEGYSGPTSRGDIADMGTRCAVRRGPQPTRELCTGACNQCRTCRDEPGARARLRLRQRSASSPVQTGWVRRGGPCRIAPLASRARDLSELHTRAKAIAHDGLTGKMCPQ